MGALQCEAGRRAGCLCEVGFALVAPLSTLGGPVTEKKKAGLKLSPGSGSASGNPGILRRVPFPRGRLNLAGSTGVPLSSRKCQAEGISGINLNTSSGCIPGHLTDVITCFAIIHIQKQRISHSEDCMGEGGAVGGED